MNLAYELKPKLLYTLWLLTCRHIKLLCHNTQLFYHHLFSLLGISVLWYLSADIQLMSQRQLFGMVVSLLFIISLSSNFLLLRYDYDHRFLEQIRLGGISLFWLLLLKFLINLLCNVSIAFIYLSLLNFVLDTKLFFQPEIIINLIIIIAFISIFDLFAQSILLVGKQQLLAALIILPLIIPQFIFSLLALNEFGYLWLMAGVFLLMSCLLFALANHAVILSLEEK